MPSIAYKAMATLVKIAGIKKCFQLKEDAFLIYYDKHMSSQKVSPPKRYFKKFLINSVYFGKRACWKVSPHKTSKKAVLFLHGGGYYTEMDRLHWRIVQKIVIKRDVTVFVPIYPLAPSHTYTATFDMLEFVYNYMLETYLPEDIIVIGDSAGAQIGLSFCQYCKLNSLPQPSKMILLSPPVDFSPDEKTMKRYMELDKIDPMLSSSIIDFLAEFWVEGTNMKDYRISPIYGSFKDLPPIIIFCGTEEILQATIPELIKKATDANVEVSYYEGKGMMHVWPYFWWSRESRIAFKYLLSLIR